MKAQQQKEKVRLSKTKSQRRKRIDQPKTKVKPVYMAENSIVAPSSGTSIESVSPVASITNYETLPLHVVVTPEEMVIKPDMPEAIVTVVRPRSIEKEESISGKAADLAESVKEKTEEVIDTLASTAGLDVKKIESEIGAEPLIIPIIEQKTDTKTKSFTETVRIEKRLVERKKSVDVNLNYEELFVNGKQVQPGFAETLKEIKDKILDVVSFDDEKDAESENVPGENIPLFGEETEMEKTVPLYAEEVVVSKRFVKVADVIIRKRKVSQLEKVDIGRVTEKVTIKNPSGSETSSFQEQDR